MGVAAWALILSIAAVLVAGVSIFVAVKALDETRRSANATVDYAGTTKAEYRNKIEPTFQVTMSLAGAPDFSSRVNVKHTGPKLLDVLDVELVPESTRPTWIASFANGTDHHHEPSLRKPPAEYQLPLMVKGVPDQEGGQLTVKLTATCQGEVFESTERIRVPPVPTRGTSPLAR